MKRKLTDMTRALEQYIRGMIEVRSRNTSQQNSQTASLRSSVQNIKKLEQEIENTYLQKIKGEVEQQNKDYFENKAKELLLKDENNIFYKTCANLLFKSSPNINRDEIERQV